MRTGTLHTEQILGAPTNRIYQFMEELINIRRQSNYKRNLQQSSGNIR